MTSETVNMAPEDVEMSSEDVEGSDFDRDLEGTPYGPRHLYRSFRNHVEVREIDLRALNNTDWLNVALIISKLCISTAKVFRRIE